MELVLFRHGIATPRETHQGSDAARELTEHGRFRTRSAAQGLLTMGVEPQLVVSSPLLRARQTAEIVAEVLGVRRAIEIIDELTPGTLTGQVIKKLDALNVGAIVVVGHAPDLDLLLRMLLDGGVGPVTALKKAAAACVACPAPGAKQGELRWLLPPRTLRVLGKDED
jgi:phosphohistidine phosphatase